MTYYYDPGGLEGRAPGKKKVKPKGHFTTKGCNWVHLDTARRKLLWLRIWVTNSDPLAVGCWYLEYVYETRIIPAHLQLDHGSETGAIATMHVFLRSQHGDMEHPIDAVIYGPSTSNQVSTEEGLHFDFYVILYQIRMAL